MRDLLQKRRHLVRLRTSLMISLQNIISRNCGVPLRADEMKRLKEDRVRPLLEGNEDLALVGKASKEMVDQLIRQIYGIEASIVQRVELQESYRQGMEDSSSPFNNPQPSIGGPAGLIGNGGGGR
jgi:transposase